MAGTWKDLVVVLELWRGWSASSQSVCSGVGWSEECRRAPNQAVLASDGRRRLRRVPMISSWCRRFIGDYWSKKMPTVRKTGNGGNLQLTGDDVDDGDGGDERWWRDDENPRWV